MKILVIGSGGREHAFAWKIAQSAHVQRVFVAPGNAGTAGEPGIENIPIAAEDLGALRTFAQDQGIDLTIVGPEAPLVTGIVDYFQAANLRCFGPSAAAARLEGSKIYAKDFLARHGIPSAAYATFTTLAPALNYLSDCAIPIVIKADGLAAGKGVVIARTREEATNAARDMLEKRNFGVAGERVVIEEYLEGEEASFIVLCDGEHVIPLASSQDHKTRDDGDHGPNTGGMGAYSPAPVVDAAVEQRVLNQIIFPTVRGLAAEGTPYVGFLYAGLMIDPDGMPKVLEYNCRCGDPETQPILLRLRSDLVELCQAALAGSLDRITIEWDPRPALGVVLAAAGYPGSYRKGDPITGLDATPLPNTKIFHAGTRQQDNQVVTAGGRVLCSCALGESLAEAQCQAYAAAERIYWKGMFHRRDIGHRAIQRMPKLPPMRQ
ncbi:phosphoribosylamine--glycine ligase [Gammaproteobacteria bacterium]